MLKAAVLPGRRGSGSAHRTAACQAARLAHQAPLLIREVQPQQAVPLLDGQLRGRGARAVGLPQHLPAAALHQHRAGLAVALDGGPVQRGAALAVRQGHPGPQEEQQPHGVGKPLVGRPVQRRAAVGVDAVGVRVPALGQVVQQPSLAVLRRHVADGVPPRVSSGEVGPCAQQGFGRLHCPPNRRPVQCRLPGGICRVDVHAPVNEVGKDSNAVVQGSPLRDIEALLVGLPQQLWLGLCQLPQPLKVPIGCSFPHCRCKRRLGLSRAPSWAGGHPKLAACYLVTHPPFGSDAHPAEHRTPHNSIRRAARRGPMTTLPARGSARAATHRCQARHPGRPSPPGQPCSGKCLSNTPRHPSRNARNAPTNECHSAGGGGSP